MEYADETGPVSYDVARAAVEKVLSEHVAVKGRD